MELREKQKAEALKRMEELKIMGNCRKDFRRGVLNKSEFGGILYWLNDDEKEQVRKFEEETGNLVYHAILDHLEFGDCLALLYVSEDEEEWEMEREDLKEMYPMSYVCNLDEPMFSEYGTIGIQPRFGGLARIA